MVLMRLPPAGLEEIEGLFRPLVVLAPKVASCGTALESLILLPHGLIHAVAVLRYKSKKPQTIAASSVV